MFVNVYGAAMAAICQTYKGK